MLLWEENARLRRLLENIEEQVSQADEGLLSVLNRPNSFDERPTLYQIERAVWAFRDAVWNCVFVGYDGVPATHARANDYLEDRGGDRGGDRARRSLQGPPTPRSRSRTRVAAC
jgi:hypothetical protein